MAAMIGPLSLPETAAALEGAAATREFALAMGSDAYFFDATVQAGRAGLMIRLAALEGEDRDQLQAGLTAVNAMAHELLARPRRVLRIGLVRRDDVSTAVLVDDGRLGFALTAGGFYTVSADEGATFQACVLEPLATFDDSVSVVVEDFTDGSGRGAGWRQGRAHLRPTPSAKWGEGRAMSKREFVRGLEDWSWPGSS